MTITSNAPDLAVSFLLSNKAAFREPAAALSLKMEGHSIDPGLEFNVSNPRLGM